MNCTFSLRNYKNTPSLKSPPSPPPPITFEITPSRQFFFNFTTSREKKIHFTMTIVIFSKKKASKKYMR